MNVAKYELIRTTDYIHLHLSVVVADTELNSKCTLLL